MYRDVPLLYQLYSYCTVLYCCTSFTSGFALTAMTEVVLFMCEHYHFNLRVNHPHQPYIKLGQDLDSYKAVSWSQHLATPVRRPRPKLQTVTKNFNDMRMVDAHSGGGGGGGGSGSSGDSSGGGSGGGGDGGGGGSGGGGGQVPASARGTASSAPQRGRWASRRLCETEEEEEEELDAVAQAAVAREAEASRQASRAERLSRRAVIQDQIADVARATARM